MEGKRVILAVTNDLVGDQRVHKVAMSLLKLGHHPVLVGRKLPYSEAVDRPYTCFRLRLPFRSGPLFYACYNFRLLLYLLLVKADIFLANDLDTLPAIFLAGRLRRKRIVYDTHEYFTEVPELVNRPVIRWFWRCIERRIFPRLRVVYTVNDSIAEIYKGLYGVEVKAFPNLPAINRGEPAAGRLPESFAGHPLILYQGAVNVGRGLAEMIRAMVHLPGCRLLVVGSGDILEDLKFMTSRMELSDRIFFAGRVPFNDLAWYTRQAVIGISLEQDIGLNYHFALPNKLFDYLHAGLPVLASDLPESGALVRRVDFGIVVDRFDPEYLAETILGMVNDPDRLAVWRSNALRAAPDYVWENQEERLVLTIIGS
ncbi:MAG: glycosyltransferase family 4 protein [Bacteroidales bacterium]